MLNLKSISRNQNIVPQLIRWLSVNPEPKPAGRRIQAWQIHSYGDDVQLSCVRNLMITSPTEVQVRIDAASVNPLDIMMKDGYGRTLLKLFRRKEDIVLPITLGRDFSGTVTGRGFGVKDFNIGDEVYGVIPFYKHGSHAEYAVVESNHILQQPCGVTHTEAASLPYTALTAYSALWYTGGLCWKDAKGMRILILGASGGVGVCAVQMLRAVGATVIGTCSSDAVPLVRGLGADVVFDYKDPNYIHNVASEGSYDIILDCAQMSYKSIPNSWKYCSYISLTSPLLKNTDAYGIIGGFAYSAADLIPSNILSLSQGRTVKWAYFYPSNDGLKFMDKLIRNGKLIPIIQNTFKFNDLPQAYEATKTGHLRGKIVVDMLEGEPKE